MIYPGGKGGDGVYQAIINQIPPHSVFLSPFLGLCAVARHKRPAHLTIGVDLDIHALLKFSGWSQAHRPGWIGFASTSAEPNQNGQVSSSGSSTRSWLETFQSMLPAPRLQLVCGDGISFLRYFPWEMFPNAYAYLDPPYLEATRKDKGRRPLYRFEARDHQPALIAKNGITSRRIRSDYVTRDSGAIRLTTSYGQGSDLCGPPDKDGSPAGISLEWHTLLLDLIVTLPCQVAISGYECELYEEKLSGWRKISYNAPIRGGRSVKETLWMNYPEPTELHDTQYTGVRWQDRQRMRKMQKRWRARLEKMPRLERNALIEIVKEVENGSKSQDPSISG